MKSTPHKQQKGVALIETALTMPLVLLVLFGIFNFGFALYNKAVITNASREAARAGIVFSNDPDSAESHAVSVAETYCGPRIINFGDGDCDVVASRVGDDFQVAVSLDFTSIAGGLLGIGNIMELSSATTMKAEI